MSYRRQLRVRARRKAIRGRKSQRRLLSIARRIAMTIPSRPRHDWNKSDIWSPVYLKTLLGRAGVVGLSAKEKEDVKMALENWGIYTR